MGDAWRSKGEGSGGGGDAAADLANCKLPSLPKVWSWSAGERGGGGASSATKLRGSAGLGATSSLARRNPLPIGFSLTFPSPFLSSSSLSLFFSPIHFSCLRTSDCCSPSLPGAQLWGCSSLRLRVRTRAQRRGEEKKKNLSEGFRHPTVTPFPQTQIFRGGHPGTGESSFRADSPLGFGQAPALAEELDLF